MAQIVNEKKQAELVAGKISTTPGTYQVLITALIDNANRIFIGNGTGQDTELDPGDSMDVPGDALGKIYCKGTPPGWAVFSATPGTKTFVIVGDLTARILIGDTISIVGSTANDGFYTVADVSVSLGKTNIVVDETVPDATADGNLYHADSIALFAKG